MTDGKVNRRILEAIRENSRGDQAVLEFLTKLVYEEAEHSGQWWWKKTYTPLVTEYVKKWEHNNEN